VYKYFKAFIKHVPVKDRPKLIADLDKHVGWYKLATDWTSCEKHFKKDVMDALEWPLYRHLFADFNQDDIDFMHAVLTGKNKIVHNKWLKMVVNATRMSGEMNTSLGNGWANLMVFAYIVESKGGKWEGYVEGDDGIFASSVDVTDEDYAMLGFDVKVIHHERAVEASFCGIISSQEGEQIKNPRRVFSTFGWTHSFINAGDHIMNELLRAKALSLAYEAPQCPIVGVLAREALRRTRGYDPRFIPDGYHNYEDVPRDETKLPIFKPSESVRDLFARVFGITVAVQLACEAAIKKGDMAQVAAYIPSNFDSFFYESRYVTYD